MSSILTPLFLVTFLVSSSANGEALLIGKNEVTDATVVKKPENKKLSSKASTSKENKNEVESEG